MPGTFTYGLYPWQWLTEAGQSFHAPATGAESLLDFRPVTEQARRGQSGGWGFFAWPDGVEPPGDLVSLGTGYVATVQPSTAARNELRLKLGLAQNPAGATLVDCIADILGPLSVPDGSTGPKPLMPAADGALEIQLAGHSRVWSLLLDKANLLAANPNSRNNRIRDVIRAGIDTADEIGGVELAGKVLGSWLLTCGLTREEIKLGAPGKKTQWERLLSKNIKAKHGAAMKPKEPKTQLAETWPANGSIASGQDYTWTTPTGGSLSVRGVTAASGKVKQTSPGDSFWQVGRCDSDLSSANHWAIGPCHIIGNYAAGTCSRFADAAGTAYCNSWWYDQGVRLAKMVAGAETVLGTNAQTGGLAGINCKCESNGSTITGTVTGYSAVSVTDTAITGNLRGGVILLAVNGVEANVQLGAVTIDDGIPAAPVAAFTGTPLSGTSPLSVAFTYSGTGGTPDTYTWEKTSNGTDWVPFAGTPTIASPTESLTTGTWGIRVTATNGGGASISTRTSYITVTAPASGGGARISLLGVG